MIVIGDYFVFQEPHDITGRERFIRDVEINSREDLLDYLLEHPEEKGKITETPLTYLGSEVPNSLLEIHKIFMNSQVELTWKQASKLTWKDCQENNIIFIGHFKTLGIMDYYFSRLRYKYQLFPHKLFFTANESGSTDTISLDSYYRHGFHNDFSIATKFTEPKGNHIMLIASFSSFGKIETVKKITSTEFIDEIKSCDDKFNSHDPYNFEILFQINGIESSGFETEILKFNVIK